MQKNNKQKQETTAKWDQIQRNSQKPPLEVEEAS
jgi:hypothetical protein